MIRLVSTLLVGLFAASVTLSVAAQGPDAASAEWKSQNTKINYQTYTGQYGQRNMGVASGEFVYADNLNGPGGVVILCAGGELMAGISLEGRENSHRLFFPTITADANSQMRRRSKVTFGDERPVAVQWLSSSRTNMAVPIKPKFYKKIYNAVILGETVTVTNMKSMDDFTLTLPPINADFEAFGAECGAGKYAKR